MKKILATLIVGAFAMGAYANTPASTATQTATAATPATQVVKKPGHKKMKVAHKVTKSAKVAPAAL
jgi:xanthine/uracil/vitamin C permease (AzgA family)